MQQRLVDLLDQVANEEVTSKSIDNETNLLGLLFMGIIDLTVNFSFHDFFYFIYPLYFFNFSIKDFVSSFAKVKSCTPGLLARL